MMRSDGSRTDGRAAPTGTLGAVLVRGRQRLGLDVEAMADRLHVTADVVRALERDDPDALPRGPYRRGYLRNYLRLLGYDPEHVLARYEPPRTAAVDWRGRRVPSAVLSSFADGGPALALSLLLAVAIVAGGFWVSREWRQEIAQVPTPVEGAERGGDGQRLAVTAEP